MMIGPGKERARLDATSELRIQTLMLEYPTMRRAFPLVERCRASRLAFIGMAALLLTASPLQAQDPGPQAPPPTFKVERIPAEPHPGPPPLPVEENIQKFAAKENVMKKVYDQY